MPRHKSFADIVAEAKRSPSVKLDVRPGTYNRDGELFDLTGNLITRAKARLTPATARALVLGGAALAREQCGCGGWSGCPPVWVPSERIAALSNVRGPILASHSDADCWLERWEGAGGVVVYAHGDVEWGDAFC